MISEIVVACMAVFMVIGAADKALFNNRFGYGEEFERGLSAMGPLAMCLVGVMCAAPAIGRGSPGVRSFIHGDRVRPIGRGRHDFRH